MKYTTIMSHSVVYNETQKRPIQLVNNATANDVIKETISIQQMQLYTNTQVDNLCNAVNLLKNMVDNVNTNLAEINQTLSQFTSEDIPPEQPLED